MAAPPAQPIVCKLLIGSKSHFRGMLQEAKGEVLVSLSYLPTAEKLSVLIMQVNNVTSYKKTGESGKNNPTEKRQEKRGN